MTFVVGKKILIYLSFAEKKVLIHAMSMGSLFTFV